MARRASLIYAAAAVMVHPQSSRRARVTIYICWSIPLACRASGTIGRNRRRLSDHRFLPLPSYVTTVLLYMCDVCVCVSVGIFNRCCCCAVDRILAAHSLSVYMPLRMHPRAYVHWSPPPLGEYVCMGGEGCMFACAEGREATWGWQ